VLPPFSARSDPWHLTFSLSAALCVWSFKTIRHPDNAGHIVTHLGMNLDKCLQDFKDFESDDKSFWDKVVGGAEPEVPADVREGKTRLRAGDQVVVHGEIVESLWEEDFSSVEDQQVVEDIRERMRPLQV
jgi:DNA repair protein RadD